MTGDPIWRTEVIEWSGRLFVSDKIRKKLKKIKKKLDKPDRIRFGAFLITLNDSESDLLTYTTSLCFPRGILKRMVMV